MTRGDAVRQDRREFGAVEYDDAEQDERHALEVERDARDRWFEMVALSTEEVFGEESV